MIFDLTDDDREALERVRQLMGARSQAEVLRRLVREADARSVVEVVPEAQLVRVAAVPVRSTQAARALDATYMPRPGKPAGLEPPAEPVRSATASVPVIGTFERKPYPKGMGKAKK